FFRCSPCGISRCLHVPRLSRPCPLARNLSQGAGCRPESFRHRSVVARRKYLDGLCQVVPRLELERSRVLSASCNRTESQQYHGVLLIDALSRSDSPFRARTSRPKEGTRTRPF